MKVAVIGGGPAGMMAAYQAGLNRNDVTLFEKNEKLGKKLYITGKGRCNVTNAGTSDTVIKNVLHNGRFIYSSLNAFSNMDLIQLIESAGTPLKTERGDRVFPVSDKASDITKAMEKLLRSSGVKIRLGTPVTGIAVKDGKVNAVETEKGTLDFDAVIVATGGISYSSTGSTGDGYRFAMKNGHSVLTPKPSLVPIETREAWPYELSGLSLKNVTLSVFEGKKKVYSELGEMLFTHFGVSGPLVLSASAYITDSPEDAVLRIDLKPALDEQTLDARILRDFNEYVSKSVGTALHALLPARLLDTVFMLAKIDPTTAVGEITKKNRADLIAVLKGMELHAKGTRGFDEAIVTRGGINVKEVNASTMESKLVHGLYFAGEVLDIDALTGGFNLQVAWSTGAAAGRSIWND